jgi:hypothetical protein
MGRPQQWSSSRQCDTAFKPVSSRRAVGASADCQADCNDARKEVLLNG